MHHVMVELLGVVEGAHSGEDQGCGDVEMRVEVFGDKTALKDVLVVHDENTVVVRVEVVDEKNVLERV